MKDKKTLITIIVLLVIILPMGIYGTIKNFNTGKTETNDDNPNKEFIYNNKLYFYYENELLATYECSTCNNASNEIDDVNYHTNYYKSDVMDVNSVINKYYGIFKENDNVVLFNLIKGSIVDTYESVKNYGVSATNEFGIVKKDNKYGVIFFDLSNKAIDRIYDYVALPAHIINSKLDVSKFIVKKDGMWYILNNNGVADITPINNEIVDFNDKYIITYENGTYHIIDKNGLEYLSDLPKTKVYGVDKYIFIVNNNDLYIYEDLLNPMIKQVSLSSYNDLYFDVRDGNINIMVDKNLQESLELS